MTRPTRRWPSRLARSSTSGSPAGWNGQPPTGSEEYEEIIAYHLEQAYRYRAELGPPDAHARELAVRAGRLLGEAAIRADARLDVTAAADLLERAIALLPRDDPERRLLIGHLGPELLSAGRDARALAVLEEGLTDAMEARDDRAAAWAELGLLIVRSSTEMMGGAAVSHDAERIRDRLAALGDTSGVQQAELIAAIAQFTVGHAAEAIARSAPSPPRYRRIAESPAKPYRETGMSSVSGRRPPIRRSA